MVSWEKKNKIKEKGKRKGEENYIKLYKLKKIAKKN